MSSSAWTHDLAVARSSRMSSTLPIFICDACHVIAIPGLMPLRSTSHFAIDSMRNGCSWRDQLRRPAARPVRVNRQQRKVRRHVHVHAPAAPETVPPLVEASDDDVRTEPAFDIRTAAATFGGTAAGSGWLLTVGLRVGCRPKSLAWQQPRQRRQIGIPTSKPEPVAATPISNVST